MRLLAPAKINLFLRVGPIRDDGFHPLVTWMSTVGLFDTLTLRLNLRRLRLRSGDNTPRGAAPGESGAHPNGPRITLRCDDPRLPTDSSNLVARAALTLARLIGGNGETPPTARRVPFLPVDSISIDLQKRIPTGGGLGGGSSDAARGLLGLNRLWRLNLSLDDLTRVAAEVGSDVPFFLHGPSSLCTGRGDVVRPMPRPKPLACLLLFPGIHVATRNVFPRFDAWMNESAAKEFEIAERNVDGFVQWSQLSADQLLPRLYNDLERPAFDLHPELAALQAAAQDTLGRPVRMTGSGSTLFTLYDDLPAAQTAAERFSAVRKTSVLASTLAQDVVDDLNA